MTTIWILADQLSPDNSALATADRASSVVLFVESKAHEKVLRYHQQRIVLLYSAMRHFARELEAAGWRVDYHRCEGTPDFLTGLRRHTEQFHPDEIRLAAPNDHPMTVALPKFARRLGVPVRTVPTNQFLMTREDFSAWAGDSKHIVMEEHYRRMRRRTGWLMEPGSKRPVGGAWNFDGLNRQTFRQYATSGRTQPLVPVRETPDAITREVIALVEREFADHPGRARDFWFPGTARARCAGWRNRDGAAGAFRAVRRRDRAGSAGDLSFGAVALASMSGYCTRGSAWSACWRRSRRGLRQSSRWKVTCVKCSAGANSSTALIGRACRGSRRKIFSVRPARCRLVLHR